jgi:hypothetical protein
LAVAVDVVFFAVVVCDVVVETPPPPKPPAADCTDWDVVEVVFVVFVVLVLISDCGTGTGVEAEVVLKPRPPVTPGPSVGNVTDTASGCWAGVEVWNVTETVGCAEVFANVGHKAATIPPFLTIPKSVFELTLTPEQEFDTLLAMEFSPATQAAEHPLLKSETVQDAIWLSYVNWQSKGMRTEVMLWKFARESAFAAGTASNIEMFFRRISESVVFKTRRQILKKEKVRSGYSDLRGWQGR